MCTWMVLCLRRVVLGGGVEEVCLCIGRIFVGVGVDVGGVVMLLALILVALLALVLFHVLGFMVQEKFLGSF